MAFGFERVLTRLRQRWKHVLTQNVNNYTQTKFSVVPTEKKSMVYLLGDYE